MKQSFIQLYLREKKVYLLLFGILLFTIMLLVGFVYEQNKAVRSAQTLRELLESETSSAPGATCSIVTIERAQSLLGSAIVRSHSNVIIPTQDGETIIVQHLDSCRYVAQGNSNEYIEFFITTYDDSQIATNQFDMKMPTVSDIEILDASAYKGEKLSYDGGVHYLLRGRQIIEVAASNGSTARQKELSYQLMEEFVNKIQPL